MYQTLIDADALQQHLSDIDWVVVDCRFDLTHPDAGSAAYATSHIPGARYAHLNFQLSAPVTDHTGRHPLPAPATFIHQLQEWGIGNRTQVVAYDADNGVYAARLWWMLRWLGHDAVAVLDGGFKAWQAAQAPVTNEIPAPTPATFIARIHDEFVVDAAVVARRSIDTSWRVFDARAAERFAGEIEPIDTVAGHVPGAVNAPFTANLKGDATFRPAIELQSTWNARLQGVTPEHVIAMCGSGVTACHNILAMHVAGMEGARLYPGSWSEWIRDPQRPIAKGR
jgi:thiosulfate/3-mercaptopyruvate sulfurtransferase